VTSDLRNGRRRYDSVSKARLVEACLEPGVLVARLALENGVNVTFLRKRIKQHKLSLSQLEGHWLHCLWRCVWIR
jgi:transposase